MKITRRQLRKIIREAEGSTKKYNDDSALKGGQSKLPDKLQKGIIDKTVEDREEREEEEREEKNESMRITRRQLKRIIREERARLLNEAPTREDIERDVRAAIAKYSSGSGRMQWRMSRSDFYAMADGEFYPGISDTYYVGWTPADFEAVIAAVEGQ